MATVTHVPSLYYPDGHTFECDDRSARHCVRSFDRTGFKVTRGTVETRAGTTEHLAVVWAPSGVARILVSTEER